MLSPPNILPLFIPGNTCSITNVYFVSKREPRKPSPKLGPVDTHGGRHTTRCITARHPEDATSVDPTVNKLVSTHESQGPSISFKRHNITHHLEGQWPRHNKLPTLHTSESSLHLQLGSPVRAPGHLGNRFNRNRSTQQLMRHDKEVDEPTANTAGGIGVLGDDRCKAKSSHPPCVPELGRCSLPISSNDHRMSGQRDKHGKLLQDLKVPTGKPDARPKVGLNSHNSDPLKPNLASSPPKPTRVTAKGCRGDHQAIQRQCVTLLTSKNGLPTMCASITSPSQHSSLVKGVPATRTHPPPHIKEELTSKMSLTQHDNIFVKTSDVALSPRAPGGDVRMPEHHLPTTPQTGRTWQRQA